jgi:hypothetical protein
MPIVAWRFSACSGEVPIPSTKHLDLPTVATAALVLLGSGCATGSGADLRRVEQVAILETSGLTMRALDGREVHDASESAVMPGMHSVVVSLEDRFPTGTRSRERRFSSRPLALCFAATAGHRHLMRATYHGSQWQPDLFDESAGLPIRPQASTPDKGDCSLPIEEVTDSANGGGSPASTATSNPNRRSDDYEIDRDYVDPRLAGTGLTLDAGIFFAGDNLGSGASVSVGVQWTPLWIDDAIGFGLWGSFGFKGNSFRVSEDDGVQSRYPLLAAVQTLVPVTTGRFLLFRAGIQWDSWISRRESAAGRTVAFPLDSQLGFMGEGGVYLPFSRHLAGSLTFRYTNLRYAGDGSSYPANSVGTLFTLHSVL